jgi:hypothetical protein
MSIALVSDVDVSVVVVDDVVVVFGVGAVTTFHGCSSAQNAKKSLT